MRLATFLAAISLWAAAPPSVSPPEQAGMSGERLKRLSARVRGYIDRGELAGAVTLVSRRGKLVHLEPHGLLETASKRPMRADSIFRLASMTKPITSVAAMMLVEEGKLLLTDPVSRYIPEFKDPKVVVQTAPGSSRAGTRLAPADREINILDLLTHTAGLATGTAPALVREFDKFTAESRPDETIAGYCRRLAGLPLNFQPGTAWQYGPATNVLGRVVEVASGQSFDKFLQERIFKPLEMTDTSFWVPDEKMDRLGPVYAPGPDGLREFRPSAQMRGSRVFFSGSGGLFSTAGDYLRFCRMMLGNGASGGVRLLSRKSVELMTANHVGDMPIWPDLGGSRFGLGVSVVTDLGRGWHLGSVGTYGWGGAYGTWFWIDPKEELIGILMVQTSGPMHDIRYQVQNLVVQAIVD
jgi:CubicO group peptidase (beta-lactamase class C family)